MRRTEGCSTPASLVKGGISVFALEGSGLVEWWEGPEPYCTNIAFGGPG